MISKAEMEIMARAWQQAPDDSAHPRVQAMVRAEVNRIERTFADLSQRIEITFTDEDPYHSYEQLRHDVLTNRRMRVFKGGSETPLWDPLTNWKARAIHDWDHITHDVDFSIEGEHAAYRRSAQKNPGLAPLYLSEIVLQAAVQNTTGNFAEQKLVLPDDATVKLVDSLRGGETPQQASVLVWFAAGWLTFMRLPDLMLHLRSMGLSFEDAVVIADAASMLHDRRL